MNYLMLLLEETDKTITIWVWNNDAFRWLRVQGWLNREVAYKHINGKTKLLAGWNDGVDGMYAVLE